MNGADGSPDAVLAATRRWLERVVIGLGLCPFAAGPYHADRISYRVSDAESAEDIYQVFLALLYQLLTSDPAENETALLVLDRGLAGFDDYLEMLGTLEHAVADAGAEGIVQIASFHPGYRFDGAPAEDPANYTNRSPFPMFHLIREDGLAAALESVDDPAAIAARNVTRLREMGIERVRALLAGVSDG